MIVSRDGKFELVVKNLDCEGIRDRIRALSRLVSVASDLNQLDISLIMVMIDDHLPGDELVMRN